MEAQAEGREPKKLFDSDYLYLKSNKPTCDYLTDDRDQLLAYERSDGHTITTELMVSEPINFEPEIRVMRLVRFLPGFGVFSKTKENGLTAFPGYSKMHMFLNVFQRF